MADHANKSVVLVTGATGFIGQHLVRALLKDRFVVSALTRDVTQKIIHTLSAVHWIQADVTAPDSLTGVCQSVYGVFHLAGYAHAWEEQNPTFCHPYLFFSLKMREYPTLLRL